MRYFITFFIYEKKTEDGWQTFVDDRTLESEVFPNVKTILTNIKETFSGRIHGITSIVEVTKEDMDSYTS